MDFYRVQLFKFCTFPDQQFVVKTIKSLVFSHLGLDQTNSVKKSRTINEPELSRIRPIKSIKLTVKTFNVI